jgi:hypothetical protein
VCRDYFPAHFYCPQCFETYHGKNLFWGMIIMPILDLILKRFTIKPKAHLIFSSKKEKEK